MKNKKDLFICLLIILAIAGMWILIIRPADARLLYLKSRYMTVHRDISMIESLIGVGSDYSSAYLKLKDEYKTIRDNFPYNEEDAINEINNLAGLYDLTIISLLPQPRTPLLNDRKQPIDVNDSPVMNFSVNAKIRGTFLNIGRFAEHLNERGSYVMNIDNVEIYKTRDGAVLEADIIIKTYLIPKL